MAITLRPLRLPGDYAGLAELLNTEWAEPTTARSLEEEDAKLYETGHTYKDENGLLAGYDRLRLVAVTERDEIVGHLLTWRAPWTEPGHLNNTLIVAEVYRKQGLGQQLLNRAIDWGEQLGASKYVIMVWDDNAEALGFAESRGFAIERHSFQSVLELERLDEPETSNEVDQSEIADRSVVRELENAGIRFTTYEDELAADEGSELKLYDLYKATLIDIPGHTGEVPDLNEWRKWYLETEGYAPSQVILAVDGDKYAGVSNLSYSKETNGMYHGYTGVDRVYRGRRVALALKVKAIDMAKQRKIAYLRTDNDSQNEAILRINRRLGYVPVRGSYRLGAKLEDLLRHTHEMPRLLYGKIDGV